MKVTGSARMQSVNRERRGDYLAKPRGSRPKNRTVKARRAAAANPAAAAVLWKATRIRASLAAKAAAGAPRPVAGANVRNLRADQEPLRQELREQRKADAGLLP